MKAIAVLAGLMFLVFILGTIGNWWRLVRALVGQRKGSGLPIIAGALGTISLLIAPTESDLSRWHSFWWVPLLIDVGCVPWAIYCIGFFMLKRRDNS